MYSLEDEVIARSRLMSVRFWKEDVLVRAQLHRCLLSSGIPGRYFAFSAACASEKVQLSGEFKLRFS